MKHPTIGPAGLPRRDLLAGLGAVAAGVSLAPRFSLAAEEPKLNFYNWDTYIGETTLSDFKQASGIDVRMDLFADNAELFAKLKEGNPGYDLIVPTNDFVERMMAAGMLEALDHDKIPNRANLAPAFQDATFDPGRKFTMPYMWGTQGIGYRKSKVKREPDSWKIIFESDEFKGRIALLSEPGSVIGAALRYLGYSFNSANPEEISAAEALLTKQKPNIKVFAQDNGQDLLLSGEVDVAMEWNGDILQVMEEDDDISYVVPSEGGLIWQDCLCIPKDAPHPDNAHAFIDFVLDAQAGAAIADFIQYATPNAAAKKLMDASYQSNPAIFPPDEVIAQLEAAIYQGEARQRMIDEAWTRINAA